MSAMYVVFVDAYHTVHVWARSATEARAKALAIVYGKGK